MGPVAGGIADPGERTEARAAAARGRSSERGYPPAVFRLRPMAVLSAVAGPACPRGF